MAPTVSHKASKAEAPWRFAASTAVDRAVDRVVSAYLVGRAIPHRRVEEHGRILLEVEGAQLLIGSAKGIDAVEPLHLGHALVTAAIDDARRASSDVPAIRVDVAHASAGLRELRGRRGRLVVAKVGYAGFEPVDRLIILVMLAATASETLAAGLARELFDLPMTTGSSAPDPAVADERIEDALDEALFLDQEQVEQGERARFDAALARLERSVDDRVLILRRRLAAVTEMANNATAERDRALSVDAREAAERALKRLDAEAGELHMALAVLEQRSEEAYRSRRDALTRRRTLAPAVQRLIDVELELA